MEQTPKKVLNGWKRFGLQVVQVVLIVYVGTILGPCLFGGGLFALLPVVAALGFIQRRLR